MTMKLRVHDVYIVEREIEVEDLCPKCGHALKEYDGALVLFEYQDQERSYTFDKDDRVPAPDEQLPDQGESYMEMEWQCSMCRCTLAQGHEFRCEQDSEQERFLRNYPHWSRGSEHGEKAPGD